MEVDKYHAPRDEHTASVLQSQLGHQQFQQHQVGFSMPHVVGEHDELNSVDDSGVRDQEDADDDGREPSKNEQGQIICAHPKAGASCRDIIFERKCEWSKHVDKHDRPYKCEEPGCEKLRGFTYSGGLLRHAREVHKKFGGPKEVLHCPYPYCKRNAGPGFTRRENLNEHMRRVHRPLVEGLTEQPREGDGEMSQEQAQAQAQAQAHAQAQAQAGEAAMPVNGAMPPNPFEPLMSLVVPPPPPKSRRRKRGIDGDDDHGLREELQRLQQHIAGQDDLVKHLHDIIRDRDFSIAKLEQDLAMIAAQQQQQAQAQQVLQG